ncbi:hypothetical protein IAR50_005376 [Cryptococcus sp. DSM 104548]
MCRYYTTQVKVLEKVDKNAMFKDISSKQKITFPSYRDYWTMGPISWSLKYGDVVVVKDPEREARRAMNQARPLKRSELLTVWTYPVPQPTEALEYGRPPPNCSEIRYCYDNMPTAQVYQTQHICRAKRQVYEVIFRACRNYVSGDAFEKVIKEKKGQSVTKESLNARREAAEKPMDVGISEASIWAYISRTCVELAKSAFDERRNSFTQWAFMSAYFSWILRDYTLVVTVHVSCTNLLMTVNVTTLPYSTIVLPKAQPKFDALKSIWQQQLDALRGADEEMPLSHERWRTVLDPSLGGDWAEVGPQAWIKLFD